MSKPKVFAHRGGRAWAPENTMASFKRAIEAGCDGIELDVHRCASGELVVIHDPFLSRTTNGAGLVGDASLSELKRLTAGAWFDKEFAGEKIPTLEEVLQFVAGRVTLNLEIKNVPYEYANIEDDLLLLLSQYSHPETLIVTSFDHVFLQRFSALDSGLDVGLLAACVFIDLPEYAQRLGAKFWHPKFTDMSDASMQVAHEAGLKVNAWVVNEPQDWSLLMKWGVDGIITDDPQSLLDRLQSVEQSASAQ
jgi:glycerophosphoryl diester phosphodiesterase